MIWIVYIEIALTVLFLGGAIYGYVTGSSADEKLIAAPLGLAAFVSAAALVLTLFFWWMFSVTFRG